MRTPACTAPTLLGGFVLAFLSTFASPQSRGDAYDPPANYYEGATGTGAVLKSQLLTIMATGQRQQSYGNFRFSAPIHDADPAHPGNILLVYNRASVSGVWDAVALPWNREHLWPQSRQPGSLSNSTTGSLGDPHSLRPADPDINSNRGDMPFGFETTSGNHGNAGGGYYYPGNADRGDVARAMFYTQTRYSSSGLSLTDSFPSGNQMGDLSSLVAWHYLDPPDEFERRRNQAIYSQAMNPQYYTNNRNAYVDNPEFVWSVYIDQANDSQVTIQGGALGANGASSLVLDFGRRLVGAATPAAQSVTLNKSGDDGTYFRVTTAGAATSSLAGKFNAFRTNMTDSKSVAVGLATSTATPGLKTGTVTIDNLDVTTGGGAGRGANDGDDVITTNLTVLDHANPSFAGTIDLNTISIDFGSVVQGDNALMFDFSIYNLPSTPDFTAGLDLDTVIGSGDTSILSTNVTAFGGASTLAEGLSRMFTATFSTAVVGSFTASYQLSFSDEDLPGAAAVAGLTLSLAGIVDAAPTVSADFNGDGVVDGADLLAWQMGLGVGPGAARGDGDADGDGIVDAGDLAIWQSEFNTPATTVAAAVPEPATPLALLALLTGLASCRRPATQAHCLAAYRAARTFGRRS